MFTIILDPNILLFPLSTGIVLVFVYNCFLCFLLLFVHCGLINVHRVARNCKKEEQAVIVFEREIFRKIYGPKYENGEWKIRTNRELQGMSKGENIV